MRSPAMQKFVDGFAQSVFGRNYTEAQTTATCVTCGKPIVNENFRNDLSRKEYRISGCCQQCQDEVFGID